MDLAWQHLQLAQRALALGDLAGAEHFAKLAKMEFELGKPRQVSVLGIRERNLDTPYRERIQERLRRVERHVEDYPEPLGESHTGVEAVERVLAAVVGSTDSEGPKPPRSHDGRAAVIAHLHGDGTAQISAYVPSIESHDTMYFDRLVKHVLRAQSTNVYVDHVEKEPRTGKPLRISFTLVGEASVCRLFATCIPHFQIIGEMAAPVVMAGEACTGFAKTLDQWLNPV